MLSCSKINCARCMQIWKILDFNVYSTSCKSHEQLALKCMSMKTVRSVEVTCILNCSILMTKNAVAFRSCQMKCILEDLDCVIFMYCVAHVSRCHFQVVLVRVDSCSLFVDLKCGPDSIFPQRHWYKCWDGLIFVVFHDDNSNLLRSHVFWVIGISLLLRHRESCQEMSLFYRKLQKNVRFMIKYGNSPSCMTLTGSKLYWEDRSRVWWDLTDDTIILSDVSLIR